mmetsp:Transcript_1052/g.2310  ORF Transcript_1052/g.2310 Transcript_1052/m.2310 type:complete len:91 (-) Transcript_1052:134-406(-)
MCTPTKRCHIHSFRDSFFCSSLFSWVEFHRQIIRVRIIMTTLPIVFPVSSLTLKKFRACDTLSTDNNHLDGVSLFYKFDMSFNENGVDWR